MDRIKIEAYSKYGIDVWQEPACVMDFTHIHTDVEWNFVIKGALNYFFAGRFLTLPERQLAVFWGGIPHRLLSVTPPADCIVLHLPIAWFSKWKLSGDFLRRLLGGEFFIDGETDLAVNKEFSAQEAA